MTASSDKQGITHQPQRPKINQNGPTRTRFVKLWLAGAHDSEGYLGTYTVHDVGAVFE